jgi:hypothetical protein
MQQKQQQQQEQYVMQQQQVYRNMQAEHIHQAVACWQA